MRIFKSNLKRIFGNKARLSVLLILPLLFVSMFANGAFNTVSIGIVDNDQSKISQVIIDNLSTNKFYYVKIIDGDDVVADVSSYQVDYAIVIDKGFEQQLINQRTLPITEYYIIENPNVLNAKTHLESFISSLSNISKSAKGDVTLFYSILNDFQNSKLNVQSESDLAGKIQQAQAGVGFSVYFIILMSVITTGIISEDRNNGTLSRIFNSPITMKRYLFENLLSFIFVSLIQVLGLLLALKFVFNFYFADGFFNIFILIYTFSLVSITLGLLIISLVKTPVQAYITVGVLASPLSMLGGCYWPLDMMPKWLQNIGMFLPTTWTTLGTQEILNNGNFLDILDNIVILLLFATAFFIGGVFKKNDFIKT